MPRYKKTIQIPSTHNGKSYVKGEVIGEVTLTVQEAKILNDNPNLDCCSYELIKDEKQDKLEALKKEAKELGINFPKNINEEKLQEKINKAKAE
jgi:hypothetical protein